MPVANLGYTIIMCRWASYQLPPTTCSLQLVLQYCVVSWYVKK